MGLGIRNKKLGIRGMEYRIRDDGQGIRNRIIRTGDWSVMIRTGQEYSGLIRIGQVWSVMTKTGEE